MPKLYVVRHSFKAGGKLYRAGDLIGDLSGIKLVKIRLNEGKLVPIPAEGKELDNLTYYFQERYGFNLKERLAERASKGSISAEPVKPLPPVTTPPGTPAPAAVQPLRPVPLTGQVPQAPGK